MTKFEKEAASGRFFFRKDNRVLLRADFLTIYSKGRPYRRPLLHVFVLKHEDSPEVATRLGITATRKCGNAVHRNRGRRLVRESFRLMLPDLKPGYSLVVNVMRGATNATFASVDTQFREVLCQAGLFQSLEQDDAL